MHQFHYVGNQLFCEEVALKPLAEKFGTPLYVYSQRTLAEHYQRLAAALAPVDYGICFSVKANANLSVLRALAKLGSGFDVVSAGELQRVIAAGGDPKQCLFAGVAKTAAEIEFALRQEIYCFNCESEPEIDRINYLAARLGKKAPIAVRVNPNVAAGTHAKITTGTYENKFGIALEQIEAVYARAAKWKHLRLRGLQMHIGSQLTDVAPYVQAVKKVLPALRALVERYKLEFFSPGGGLGIIYDPALASGAPAWWQTPAAKDLLTPALFAEKLRPLLQPIGLKILVEPGRFIMGNAGVLLTRVEYIKCMGKKTFVIVDAAMNDLIRPAFYEAYHEIVPLIKKGGARVASDVVGGICESGDFFCKDRPLAKVGEGDYLALMSAGAYGMTMASNYNTRPLAAEVLVNGQQFAEARARQPVAAIWAGEKIAAWLK